MKVISRIKNSKQVQSRLKPLFLINSGERREQDLLVMPMLVDALESQIYSFTPSEASLGNIGWSGLECLLVVSPKQGGSELPWSASRWTVHTILLTCITEMFSKIFSHYILCLMEIKIINTQKSVLLTQKGLTQKGLCGYFCHTSVETVLEFLKTGFAVIPHIPARGILARAL